MLLLRSYRARVNVLEGSNCNADADSNAVINADTIVDASAYLDADSN